MERGCSTCMLSFLELSQTASTPPHPSSHHPLHPAGESAFSDVLSDTHYPRRRPRVVLARHMPTLPPPLRRAAAASLRRVLSTASKSTAPHRPTLSSRVVRVGANDVAVHQNAARHLSTAASEARVTVVHSTRSIRWAPWRSPVCPTQTCGSARTAANRLATYTAQARPPVNSWSGALTSLRKSIPTEHVGAVAAVVLAAVLARAYRRDTIQRRTVVASQAC